MFLPQNEMSLLYRIVRRVGQMHPFKSLTTLILTVFSVSAFSPSPTVLASPTSPLIINQSTSDGIPSVKGINNSAWPSIVSQAAVVLDMRTGTVVYAKHPNVEHYPASITKIMTALLALKDGHLNDTLTASKNAVSQPPDKLYMLAGEKKKLKPLLYGLLLDSANDVAVEIAEHYGGSVKHFATMMNQEAVALGAKHTHFVNPNGLPNPKHVTTAYDMALIARAAMQYPEFRKIVDTKYYDWKGKAWHSHLSNINGMLFRYPGCIGIKTGFTSVAHETLAVAATRGKDTFLAILMDTPTNAEIQKDATRLLNYAFAHYQTQTIIKKGEVTGTLPGGGVTTTATQTVLATVEKGSYLSIRHQVTYDLPGAGIQAGRQVGTLELVGSEGAQLATQPISASANWKQDEATHALHRVNVLIPLIILLSVLLKLLRVSISRRIHRQRAIRTGISTRTLSFRSDRMSRFRNWNNRP